MDLTGTLDTLLRHFNVLLTVVVVVVVLVVIGGGKKTEEKNDIRNQRCVCKNNNRH